MLECFIVQRLCFTRQATYRPFLRQLLEEVFHPDRPECPDIEHTSGGLTDLLKTGFSMFMKVRLAHSAGVTGRILLPIELYCLHVLL